MVDGGISTMRTEGDAATAGDERAVARVTERHRGERRGQPISGNQPAASPSSRRSRSVNGSRPAARSR